MNAIFAVIFLLAAAAFLVADPEGFLAAMLSGGERAATLCLSLLAAYCVWLGFFKVLERSGLAEKFARRTMPLTKKLFRTEDGEALKLASGNLTANLLGLPGAPTPLGVKATERFLKTENGFAADMLFVLNATSLQLLPTTAIALRLAAGSSSPADIFLPTLLATLLSSLAGALLLLFTARIGQKFAQKRQLGRKRGTHVRRRPS